MKKVSLKFSDLVPSQSRCLDITDGELCSQYLYNIIDKSLDVIFSTYSRGNFVLIHCHNKSLYCYCRFDISDDFQILIEVFKPKSRDYRDKYVSDSFLKIKDYLFNPPFLKNTQDICEKIVKIYNFDPDIINTIRSIDISVKSKSIMLSQIIIQYGDL